ncbi:MAG: LpxD N-terminal domain-containing protein, partial [Chthoniobacterales bacterium]
MKLNLQELAAMTGGKIAGDQGLTITGAASLTEAGPGEITFYDNWRYLPAFRRTRASAAFVPEDFEEQVVNAQIRVANPTKAFEKVVFKFAPPPITFASGLHPSAVVSGQASLGKGVAIAAHVVIEPGARVGDGTRLGANSYVGHETTIGDGCLIYPNVTIRERTRIGNRVIIHSCAVIGAHGFGFEMESCVHK